MVTKLSGLLRMVRLNAGCSQLELALRLDVSQRHINFIERDRERPSRGLLLAWLRELGGSASLANAALLNGGYSPLLPHASMPSRLTGSDSVAVRTMELHYPNPGHVFNSDWYIVQANPASRRICELVMPGVWKDDPLDMLATLADPRGWLSRAHDPARIAGALLAQVRTEQWTRPGLKLRVDMLESALESRYGKLKVPVQHEPLTTSFDVTLDTPLGLMSFCAVQTVSGLPHDAMGTRLRTELWYPTDMQTSHWLRQHAQGTGTRTSADISESQ